MPVLPTYEAKEQLNPDSRGMPRPTFTTAAADAEAQTGQAMGKFGAAIGQMGDSIQANMDRARAEQERVAAHAKQLADKKLEFSAGVQDDARRQELAGFLDDAKQTMPVDGVGFHDEFMKKADEIAEQRFKAMSPEIGAQYRERWQAERIGWSHKAAQLEASTGKTFATGKLGELQQSLIKEIDSNPAPEVADAAYQRGVERINAAPFISPAEKAQMLKGWREVAQTAEAQARYGNDGAAMRRVLGVPSAESRATRGSESTAMQFFMSKGWTKEQAAGIVGNLLTESRLNTGARAAGDGADGSDSIGIAQWNAGRAAALKKFAADQGKPVTDLETQLAFVDHELRTSHKGAGDKLSAAKTAAEAAAAIVTDYERPAGSDKGAAYAMHWTDRLGHARRLATGNEGGVRLASGSTMSDAPPEQAGDSRYDAIPPDARTRLVRSAEANTSKQKATVTQLMKDDEQSIMETGKPIESLTPDQVAVTHGPEAAQAFIDNRRQAISYFNHTSDFDRLPTEAIREQVEQLRPVGGQAGYGNQDAFFRTANEKAAKVLKLRDEDPGAAVDSHSDVKTARAARDANPQNVETWRALAKARLAAQEAIGIPESSRTPITVAEGQRLFASVTDAPENEQAKALRTVAKQFDATFGEDAPKAFATAITAANLDKDTRQVAAGVLRKIGLGKSVSREEFQNLEEAHATGVANRAVNAVATPEPTVYDAMGSVTSGGQNSFAPPAPETRTIPAAAVEQLQKNPHFVGDFLAKFGTDLYGAGVAAKVVERLGLSARAQDGR